MARLLWRDAQGIEGTLELSGGETRVGRAVDCAIRTDDAMVSRYHARVVWSGNGFVLEDLASANGVFFQEQRIQSHQFKHGDAVRCGSLWLRFVDGVPGAGGAAGAAPAPSPNTPAPMMQHPGMGAVAAAVPTGHIAAQGGPAVAAGPLASPALAPSGGLGVGAASGEAEVEIRVLRRRVEQLQTELKIYRTGKFNAETARKMEDLEADLSAMEVERDNLKGRLARAEDQMTAEAGSVKVKRAIEIASMTAEAAASLNDTLSSLRIEVMAAEGEFEQFSHSLPRSSFELIRQSLKDAAAHCDEARDLLRRLREVAG